jgi:hypothetical protein
MRLFTDTSAYPILSEVNILATQKISAVYVTSECASTSCMSVCLADVFCTLLYWILSTV